MSVGEEIVPNLCSSINHHVRQHHRILPNLNIFINYASSRSELKAAQKWLGQELGIENREELMSLLATLTLYYIAEYGCKNDTASMFSRPPN